jgi:hypothetical protein
MILLPSGGASSYVALPVARRDDGTLVHDHAGAVECASADDAIALASELALAPGYAGGRAFHRTAIPAMGYYAPAEILERFGQGWLD